MKSRLPIDELNALKSRIKKYFDATGIKSRKDAKRIEDAMLDFFLLTVVFAVNDINLQFGTNIHPSAQEIQDTVYRPIHGATWVDRLFAWYMAGCAMEDIFTIIETEAHRVSNEIAYDTAIKAGAKTKTWQTMLDDRVRDTHSWLQGTTVPIDGYFYSYNGGQTLFPGQWGIPEEDINCRCELEFK